MPSLLSARASKKASRSHTQSYTKVIALLIFAYTTVSVFLRASHLELDEENDTIDTRKAVVTSGSALASRPPRKVTTTSSSPASSSASKRSRQPEGSHNSHKLERYTSPSENLLAIQELAEKEAASVKRPDEPPVVEAVLPPHGPRSGGNVVLIRGKNFGEVGSLLQATVNDVPCEETRWLSSEALHCMVPKGSGRSLVVRVMHCSCSALPEVHSKRLAVAKHAKRQQKMDGVRPVYYSYDEDALGGVFTDSPPLNLRLQGVPLQMNRLQLVGNYELHFYSPVTRKQTFYALSPALASTLAKGDIKVKHETCAIVGHSGSLLGSSLGSTIDSYQAVFRVDNSPSAYRYAQDVGRRTTYQVLNHEWAEVLLNYNSEGMPHVARWWLDVATLILWSSSSEKDFIKLKWLYPEASVILLSRDLEAATRGLTATMKDRIEQALNVRTGVDPLSGGSGVSSLLYATMFAIQTCRKVDVYGVFPRCGRHSHRCRYTYWDDSEPSTDERQLREFEQKILIAMHIAGYVNTNTATHGPGKSRSADNSRHLLQSLPDEGSNTSVHSPQPQPHTVSGKCDAKACVPSCSQQGRFVNDSCKCDLVYSGPSCATNKLKDSLDQITHGLRLNFTESGMEHLVMTKVEANFTAPGATEREPVIVLPELLANHSAGMDHYKLDMRMYNQLPANDSYIFNTAKQRQKRTFGTCALVGNSGSMLYKQYGKAIDDHDVVYRFNQAPVEGYEIHVGARSSHESLNSAWMKKLLETRHHRGNRWNWRKKSTSIVIFEMFDPASFKFKNKDQIAIKDKWWRKSYSRLRNIYPEKSVVVLSPEFMAWSLYLYNQIKVRFQRMGLGAYGGEKPMSGYYAVLFSLQVCDKVDLYGFTPYRDSDRNDLLATRYHYFDGAIPRQHSHSFDLTRYVYQVLSYTYRHFHIHD